MAGKSMNDVVPQVVVQEKRDRICREIMARASDRGYTAKDFDRFVSYLSINLGLEDPVYVDGVQKPRNYMAGLTARPVHETSQFLWANELESKFSELKEELLKCSTSVAVGAHPQDLADRGKWSVLYFFGRDDQVNQIRAACPLVCEVLERIPGTGRAGNTYLSVLKAGTHIQKHYGPTNARLRCHLALKVPNGARIRIGTSSYGWTEGKCLIFDDSYEHEVWNDGEGERVVLIIDFWHPDMSEAECWALHEARRLPDGLRDFSPDSSAMRAVLA